MQVSKKLGLKAISKDMSKAQRRAAYGDRIKALNRHLAAGKLSPKLAQRCQEYVRMAEFKIRQIDNKPVRSKSKLTKYESKAIQRVAKSIPAQVRKAQAKFDKAQGILPGFLRTLNNARVEELVAEKIFQALRESLHSATAPAKLKVVG